MIYILFRHKEPPSASCFRHKDTNEHMHKVISPCHSVKQITPFSILWKQTVTYTAISGKFLCKYILYLFYLKKKSTLRCVIMTPSYFS